METAYTQKYLNEIGRGTILSRIKKVANELFLFKVQQNLGMIDEYARFEADKDRRSISGTNEDDQRSQMVLYRELTLLLPIFPDAGIKGKVDKIETDGIPSAGGYYPEGSMYRVSIMYSGTLSNDKKSWFYRSCTLHYTKDMKLIKTQDHWDDIKEGWGEFKPLIDQAIADNFA